VAPRGSEIAPGLMPTSRRVDLKKSGQPAIRSAFATTIDGSGCHIPVPTASRSKLISTSLRRGLRKRCPHCGEGPLFSGWSQLECCSVCGLVFTRNPGDTWAFVIVGDRLPLAALIVLIYFGVVRSYRVLGLAMMGVLLALLVWTSPSRWGAGIALHYLSRVYWPDPANPIPPPHAPRKAQSDGRLPPDNQGPTS
jgi:uncharacterized protein (DUF983 family)